MNFANLFDRMGDFDTAEVLHRETVQGLSTSIGKNHTSRLMVSVAYIA